MKWAQRWSVNEDGEMVMDDHGSWVENAYYEYLKADYAVLKADAQLVVKHLGEACAENARLKAEVERLTKAHSDALADFWAIHKGYFNLKAEVERLRASSFVTAVPVEQYERLIKAGDAMAEWMDVLGSPRAVPLIEAWQAAKETPPNA